MNGMSDSMGQDRADEDREQVEITPKRLDELMRWHGTDESALPPAHTLQNLSRDTVAALRELARAREIIARQRDAMGRAFWATNRRELNAILLEALGPPQDGDADAGARLDTDGRLDPLAGHDLHHAGSTHSISSRAS